MKTMVELEREQIESIIVDDLHKSLCYLEKDLERVKELNQGHVFSKDKEEDIKEIKKHIKSLKRIIKYYGGSV